MRLRSGAVRRDGAANTWGLRGEISGDTHRIICDDMVGCSMQNQNGANGSPDGARSERRLARVIRLALSHCLGRLGAVGMRHGLPTKGF
jgi:hypothetical protein